MSESLRDQLLKSGLVKPSKSHLGSASSERHRAPGPGGKGDEAEPDLARAYALRAQREREEREAARLLAERQARERKERKQKLAALLSGRALNSADADLPRHFLHAGKIRRIYCTREQLLRLNRGELAVVQFAGRYLLVEREIAIAAQSIEPQALVLLCEADDAADDDVPPDLIW